MNVTDRATPVIVGGVAHEALQGGEAVAFDAARRRVFVASRTSACLVEADVRDAAVKEFRDVIDGNWMKIFLLALAWACARCRPTRAQVPSVALASSSKTWSLMCSYLWELAWACPRCRQPGAL